MNKTKEIEITLPKKLEDFKIKHVTYLTTLGDTKGEEGNEYSTLNKCKHLANYSGIDIELIKSANPSDVNKAFNHILRVVAEYKPSAVKTSVQVAGEYYDLINIAEQTAGWLIDYESQNEDFITKPELLAALCYIERGKKYGDVKTSERAELFRDEFKAVDFIDLTGFFLQKFESFIESTAFTMRVKTLKLMKSEIVKARLKVNLKQIRLLLLRK